MTIFFSISRDSSGFWIEYACNGGQPKCLGPYGTRSAAVRSGAARGWKHIVTQPSRGRSPSADLRLKF